MTDDPIQAEAERLAKFCHESDMGFKHNPVGEVAAALRRQREAGEEDEAKSTALHADLNRRAAKALGKPFEGPGSSWHDIPECITQQIEAAYQRGLADGAREEREACFKIVVENNDLGDVEDLIRARGEKPSE